MAELDEADVRAKSCTFPMINFPACDIPFRDAPGMGNKYLTFRVIFVMMGIVATAVTGYQVCRVYQTRGALQKPVYVLLFVSSLTIVIRGIDPESWGNLFPRWTTMMLEDLCVGFLYSIIFSLLTVWLTLAQQLNKSAVTEWLKRVGTLLIVFTWLVQVVDVVFSSRDPFEGNFYISAYVFIVMGGLTIVITFYAIYAGYTLEKMLRSVMQPGREKSSNSIGGVAIGVDSRRKDDDIIDPSSGCFDRLWAAFNRISKITKVVAVLVVAAAVVSVFLFMDGFDRLESDKYADGEWVEYEYCRVISANPNVDCMHIAENVDFPAEVIAAFAFIVICSWIFWKIPQRSEESDEEQQINILTASTIQNFSPSNRSKRSQRQNGNNRQQHDHGFTEFIPTEVLVSEEEEEESQFQSTYGGRYKHPVRGGANA